MRKFIILIAIASMFAACGNADSKTSEFKPTIDTTKVEALWKIGKVKKSDSVFRIVADVFKQVNVDTASGKAEMKWVKDTLYGVPFIVDTVKKEVKWYMLPPVFVQEITVQPLLIDTTRNK